MITTICNNLFPKAGLLVCCWLFMVAGKAQQPKLMLPVGHTSDVNSVSFSSNGKLIVTASDDNTAKIWDAQNGTLLIDLKGEAGPILTASFSFDSKKILTVSGDTVKVWDATSGALLAVLKGHSENITGAGFSPDGKKIVTSSYDKTARIWDVRSGAILVSLHHANSVASANFSPDGKKVVTASSDSTAKIWDVARGTLLFNLKGHMGKLNSACFSPDGKKIVTTSWDSTARIWDVASGALLADLKGHHARINSACFSPNNEKIVTASGDKSARIWSVINGKPLAELTGYTGSVKNAFFSPDGNIIVTVSGDKTVKIWDAECGSLLDSLNGHTKFINNACFSGEGRRIATASGDFTAKIWDVQSAALLVDLRGHTHGIKNACFSPDTARKIVVTASLDGTVKLWDEESGNLGELKGNIGKINTASFSPDGIKIVTASWDHAAKIWDAASGNLIVSLKGHTGGVTSACFSSNGKKIVTASWDSTAKIWDATTGALLDSLKGHKNRVSSACFSPDGKKIVTASYDHTARIWDLRNKSHIMELKGHTGAIRTVCFSPDGTSVATASEDSSAKIWNAESGALLTDLKGHKDVVFCASFSPDGKKVVTASRDHTAKIWEATSGRLIGDLKGHNGNVSSAYFSPDGTKIITTSEDNTAKVWDAEKGSLLYTFFVVDSSDFLVVDKDDHYDGTPAARKMLYYTCGSEVIELQQLKDKLWVPGLVGRINKGEAINTATLSQLEICGLTPVVKQIENRNNYQFDITPRKGGLGETILYVNGIETRKYNQSGLKIVGGAYELLVKKEELKEYLMEGRENVVSVKAYTKENDISSRGATVLENVTRTDTTHPNLYGVVIGVSDYKGDELHLQYAAKDAGDFSKAVLLSAGKLLGKDHVFIYNLSTAKEHYEIPEKKSIRDVFTQIAKKATANDILLIFFAGHGVVGGEKKQFYFLTADASAASITPTGVKDVGISTTELMDWMKPATIKAQKRILILDACQSGMAINEIFNIGKSQGYLAVRNDDKAEEIRQIDKLNEKAGLYILAASASNQSAYEMGRYSQGLLTYALLKAIKEHPEVLEKDKYLNISEWFNQAVKIVADIVREAKLRQEPQLITTTSFNIGVVDGEVLAKIVLPEEKPLFGASNFQNTDSAVAYDNLLIGRAVNDKLNEVSSRGAEAAISCLATTDSPDAYFLGGRYEVNDDDITVRVGLRQSRDKPPIYSFEVKCKMGDVETLTENIVQKALSWIAKHK